MKGTTHPALQVEIRDLPAQPYLSKHARAPLAAVAATVQEGYSALYHRLQQTGTGAAGPPFLVAGYPKEGHLDIELGAPCAEPPPAGDGFEARTLPAGRAAVTVHRGSYEGLAAVYPRLREWIAANHLDIAGPPREVYLTPPGEEPVTEVVWPLAG